MTQRLHIITLLTWAVLCTFSCKKGDDEIVKGAEKLPCYIDANTTLTNHNANGVDYVAECPVEVFAGTLTIEPGTTIEFPEGTYLWVYNSAILRCAGTAADPVIMKSTANGVYWDGLLLESNSAQNQLLYTEIQNAGLNLTRTDITSTFGDFSDKSRAASVVCDGRLRMENCTIQNGRGDAVLLGSSAMITGFSNNILDNNNGYALRTYAGLLTNLNLKSCTITNNRDNFVALYSISSNEEVLVPTTIQGISVPYLAISELSFLEGVDVEPGTTLYFKSETFFAAQKYLVAKGTSAQPIVFRGVATGAAAWGGVLVNSNDNRNEMAFCNVSDGGQVEMAFGVPKANIAVNYESRLRLTNCRSTSFEGCAVAVGATANFTNQSTEIPPSDICSF